MFTNKAIKVLHTFLRYDQAVFQRMRPNRPLLMKMRLEDHINSTNSMEAESALELAYFFLRYHRAIDFGDFSDVLHVTQRIRRYHDYKVWFEIEELSGQHDDLSGNFTDFKDVTQKALTEILAHIERLSAESEQRIKQESLALSNRVNGDLTNLNNQIAELKQQKDGVQSENYKKLLDLLVKLQNKLQLTEVNLASDLKKEFAIMINNHAQARDQNDEKLMTQFNTLKGGAVTQEDLEKLRLELHKTANDIGAGNDSNSQNLGKRLFDLLGQLEQKQDEKFNKSIEGIQAQLPQMIQAQDKKFSDLNTDSFQKVLQLIVSMEGKVDQDKAEIMRALQAEIQALQQSGRKELNASSERIMNIVNQIKESTDFKTANLQNEFNNTKNEITKLINERSRTLETVAQSNQQKALELITETEKKLERLLTDSLRDQTNRMDANNEEMKIHVQGQLKSFYLRVSEELDGIESKEKNRQDKLGSDFKRELQAIVDERVTRVEGLTKENFTKCLQSLLVLEKRISERQTEQLEQVRADFAKSIAQLNTSQLLAELNETFGQKIKNVEQQLSDQDRSLTAHFDHLIRQANKQLDSVVKDAVLQANENAANSVDSKIDEFSRKSKNQIDAEIKKAKDNLNLVINNALEIQQQDISNQVKRSVEDSKGDFTRQIDRVISDMNSKMNSAIDRRLDDNKGDISQQINAKLSEYNNDHDKMLNEKIQVTFQSLWSKTQAELESSGDRVSRKLDGKIDTSMQDLLSQFDQKLRDQQQSIKLEFNEVNNELTRNLGTQINRATANLTDSSGNVDEVTKAQVDRLLKRLENLEQQCENDRRSTQALLAEQQKSIMTNVNVLNQDLSRNFQKLLSDSIENSEQKVKTDFLQKLEDSQRAQDRGIDDKLTNLQNSIQTKAGQDMQIYCDNSVRKGNERVQNQLTEQQNQLTKGFQDKIESVVQGIVTDNTNLANKYQSELDQLRSSNAQELNLKMGEFKGSVGNINEVNRAIEDLRQTQSKLHQAQESQFKLLGAQQKALESEVENIVNIKVSNAQRAQTKAFNEQMRELNETTQGAIKNAADESRNNLQNIDVTMHQMKLGHEANKERLDQLSTTIGQYADIIRAINQKLDYSKDQLEPRVKVLEDANISLADKINQVIAQFERVDAKLTELAKLEDRINMILDVIKKLNIELKAVQGKVGPELDTKLTLIIKSRDDMLKRIEAAEHDVENMKTEARNTVQRQDKLLKETVNEQNDQIKNMIGSVNSMQNNVKKSIEKGMADLNAADLVQQKEINQIRDNNEGQLKALSKEVKNNFRTVQSEFAGINGNFQGFQDNLNNNTNALQSDLDNLKQEYQLEMERMAKLINQGKIGGNSNGNSEGQNETIKELRKQLVLMGTNLDALRSDLQNMRQQMAFILKIEPELKDFRAELAQMRIVFKGFQRFIDEQSIDKLKMIRSGSDASIIAKLQAVEWLSRYMSMIPPGNINASALEFQKEFMTGKQTPRRAELVQLSGHHQETVFTIVNALRDQQNKLESNALNVANYDAYNAMNCELLNGVLVNDQCNEQFVQMNGMTELGRLVQEQPMPSEVDEDWNYGPKWVNGSFKIALKCIMQSLRSERAILEFMTNSDWMERLLQIAEEFQMEEVTITIVRSLRLIFRSETAFSQICNRYPSMGEFLCQQSTVYPNSQSITSEALSSLEMLLRRPHYVRLIGAQWQNKILSLKNDPIHQSSSENIDLIVKKLRGKA